MKIRKKSIIKSRLTVVIVSSLILLVSIDCETRSSGDYLKGFDKIRLDILKRLAINKNYEGTAARMLLAEVKGDTNALASANLAIRSVDNGKLIEAPDGHYWNWHYDIALYYLFRNNPLILYPETRDTLEKRLWQIANLPSEGSAVCRTITNNDPLNVKVTMYTENHTLWRASSNLLLAQLFEDRIYEDNRKGADHCRFWEQWLNNYLDYRAGHMFWEVSSSTYENVILTSLLDLNSFAHSARIRKKAAMLIDLILATGAIESLDGIRGGGKCRQYNAFHGQDRWLVTSRLFFGLGELPEVMSFLTFNKIISTYRPPPVIARLATDREKLGSFVIKSRRPHSINPEAGYMCRKYTYVSPDFILGGFQVFNYGRFTAFPENKWAGLIMRGHPDARIIPYFHPRTGRDYSYHEYFQHENVMIAKLPEPSKVYFANVFEEIVERNGWIFARMNTAYAAVRPAAGAYKWESFETHGRFAVLTNSDAPIIIEADTCANGFEAFQSQILSRHMQFDSGLLKYETRHGQTIQYRYGESPCIDGKSVEQQVNLYPLFDSPYLKSQWQSGYIYLEVEDDGLILDFRDPKHPERLTWHNQKNRIPESASIVKTDTGKYENHFTPPGKPAEILFRANFEDGCVDDWSKNTNLIEGGYENSSFAITTANPYDRIPIEINWEGEENCIPIGPETRISFAIRSSQTGIVALFGYSKATFNNFQSDYFYFPGGRWKLFDIRVRDFFPEQAGDRLQNVNFQVVPYLSGEIRIDNIKIYNPISLF